MATILCLRERERGGRLIDANERMPRDSIHLEVRSVWEMHGPVHVSRGVGASNEGRKERGTGDGGG